MTQFVIENAEGLLSALENPIGGKRRKNKKTRKQRK
jgi:hypothetical protein